MAKKKKRRRPKAGPPPGQRPELVAGQETAKKPERAASKGSREPPAKPGYRGPLIRAVLVAALFYPYLVYIAQEEAGIALLISLGAFVVMLPAGIALDRIRYRIQRRRYRQDLEGSRAE